MHEAIADRVLWQKHLKNYFPLGSVNEGETNKQAFGRHYILMLDCIKSGSRVLKQASLVIKSDLYLVLLSISINRLALQYASPNLQQSSEMIELSEIEKNDERAAKCQTIMKKTKQSNSLSNQCLWRENSGLLFSLPQTELNESDPGNAKKVTGSSSFMCRQPR